MARSSCHRIGFHNSYSRLATKQLGCASTHFVTGTIVCYTCHDNDPATPPAETVKPPYYGTVDTKAKDSGNTVQVANTNENWSVGDFMGLDNDYQIKLVAVRAVWNSA